MRLPGFTKINFRIPNPFRRREAGGGDPLSPAPSFSHLLPNRGTAGREAPVGWHTPAEPTVLRVANPDRSPSPPERPALTRIDTEVGTVPRIEIQSATTVASPLSATPSLNRQHAGGSDESLGDYNPQWAAHAGGHSVIPVVDAQSHGTLHVVNGSPSTSGSSSPESVRSRSPETHAPPAPQWGDAFDPRQFPPPGGFRPLERNGAIRVTADDRARIAFGKSIERPGAPRPDDARNLRSETRDAAGHGSSLPDGSTPARPADGHVNFSRPFGPNNPFPGHTYGTGE